MAQQNDDLTNAIGSLSVDEMTRISNEYETIFSWDIKKQTGDCGNLMLNLIDKIREKYDIILDEDNAFSLNRFYLQLIICYELYFSGNYKESLLEIENVIKSMDSCVFDESTEQYSDACNHIARSTNAYISSSLNLDYKKVIENIKPVNSLNRAEKAAICAIKARVFMEYPPIGNDIALKFANEARNLHSTEPEWIIIWLKAKGRVRRFYSQFKMPENDEVNAAEILCTTKTRPRFLVQASKLYMEVAFCHKLSNNREKSMEYYKLSSDLTLKAVELANDNLKILYSCLMTYIDYPTEFHSKSVVDQVIQKLTNVKNSRVDQVLGKYYLKHEKNYEKAKMYLSRAMAAGHFSSALQLVKVECLLRQVEEFPLVQTLNMIYDVFPSAKRRLIILSQILIYYYYYDNNSKDIMHYLKLYMDQDIDDAFKKRHLIFAFPLFKVGLFKAKQFLNMLSTKVKYLMNTLQWNTEEKKIVDNTFERFCKMLTVRIYENRYPVDNKSKIPPRNYNNNTTGRYPNKQPRTNNAHNNWRKQQSNSSEITSSTNKNDPQQCVTKNTAHNNDYKKPNDSSIELNMHQIDKPIDNFETDKRLNNEKSQNQLPETVDNLNTSNSSSYAKKLNKFENEYSSLGNIHIVSSENDTALRSNKRGMFGRGNNNLSLQNFQDRQYKNPSTPYNNKDSRNRSQNSFQNNHNAFQHASRGKNLNWRNNRSKNECNFNSDAEGSKHFNWQKHQSYNSKNKNELDLSRDSTQNRQDSSNNTDGRTYCNGLFGSRRDPKQKPSPKLV